MKSKSVYVLNFLEIVQYSFFSLFIFYAKNYVFCIHFEMTKGETPGVKIS